MKNKILLIVFVVVCIGIGFFANFFLKLLQPSEISKEDVREIALEVQSEANTEATPRPTSKPKKSNKKSKDTTPTQSPAPTETTVTEKKSKYIKSLEKCKKMLDGIFYDTGERYVMNDPEFKFYSDLSCDKEFLISKKLTFVNSLDLEMKNDNGFTIYISRSTDGYVCSVEKPYFDKQSED